MKKFIKNNFKLVIAFILGIIISGGSVFAATIHYNGTNVGYDNTTSGLKDSSNNDVEDVQTAIDVLNTKMQSELFLAKYITKSGSPTYRLFGKPTTSSPETAPTGKTVYAALYSDGQYGVCIKREESGTTNEYCFRHNNWLSEKKHLEQVFTGASCGTNTDHTMRYCNASDYYCYVGSNGRVFCRDSVTLDYCHVLSDGYINCGQNQS